MYYIRIIWSTRRLYLRRYQVTKGHAENEGGRAKPKANAAAGTRAGTVVPLFIGFTGFGRPQRQRQLYGALRP